MNHKPSSTSKNPEVLPIIQSAFTQRNYPLVVNLTINRISTTYILCTITTSSSSGSIGPTSSGATIRGPHERRRSCYSSQNLLSASSLLSCCMLRREILKR